MLIDTHAHVHDAAFDADRDAVVERMRAAGIASAVMVGCDLADSARALDAARRYDLFSSVGIHPHEAKSAPADIAAEFAPFLNDPRVLAIGETGLDYYYDHSPRAAQQTALREQIRIARQTGKPVIFHHRDAFDDFVWILREEWQAHMRGVVHCFTGDVVQAKTYVEEFGLHLGVGGVLTFKSAGQVRDAVAAVGIEHIVLETDCPYLAPVPHRGARNEPAFVTATARKVGELLALTPDEVAAATTRTAQRLFAFPAVLPQSNAR